MQLDYIHQYTDSFENALNSIMYQDPINAWRKYGGEKSLVDFLIINEFSMNYDSYGRSTFLYKKKKFKLHIGSSWVYD